MALLAWVARVAGRAVENKGLRAPEMRNLRTAPAPMEDVGSAQMDQPIGVDPRYDAEAKGRVPRQGQTRHARGRDDLSAKDAPRRPRCISLPLRVMAHGQQP